MVKAKLSNLTFGQARRRGYNKKEWERAVKISKGLKKYYQQKRIIKSQKVVIKTKPKKEIQQELFKEIRIRKQVVLNFRSDREPYAISIRAITINPEITEKGLLLAIQETMHELNSIQWNLFNRYYKGLEVTQITSNEDKRLNDYRIHIEIQIKKDKPINFIK